MLYIYNNIYVKGMSVLDSHVAKCDGLDLGTHSVPCPIKPFSMTNKQR
jgi:hypothetical protein